MRARSILLGVFALAASAVISVIALANRDVSARQAELNRQSATIQTRSGTLEYARTGAGPPVLVIHGAGGGFDQGLLIADTFIGDGFDVIAPSRFGYLQSALPSIASTAAQADAIADLLDALGIERVSVVGFSGGSPPALQLALRHPDRVRCLVFMSSAPFTPHRPPEAARPIPDWAYRSLLGNDVLYWLMTKTMRAMLEEAFDARADLRSGSRTEEEGMIGRLIDGFSPASQRVPGIANEGAAIDPDALYEIERIAAPTFVLHSRDDRLNQFAIGEDLAQRIPGARFIAYESGGHLMLGHHASTREATAGFLRDCAAP